MREVDGAKKHKYFLKVTICALSYFTSIIFSSMSVGMELTATATVKNLRWIRSDHGGKPNEGCIPCRDCFRQGKYMTINQRQAMQDSVSPELAA